MMQLNMGYMFYKHYFDTIKDDEFLEIVKKKNSRDENMIKQVSQNLEKKFKNLKDIKLEMQRNPIAHLGNITFKLSTTYPGLLIGSGYIHSVTSVDGDLALGFDFDYTTGLPIIRGSSIKGVLRSAFPTKDNDPKKEYIKSILGEVDIKALKENLFENGDNIFFDAYIIGCKRNLLDEDYITPHSDELKNPIPIRFLKVAPEVTFEFSFAFDDGVISKKEKEKLAKQIILDFGLGAKTNVGYGKFKDFSVFKTKEEIEKEKIEIERQKQQYRQQQEERQKREKEEKLKKQEEGIKSLLSCETLSEGFKLLKEIFGAKPKPTEEQKEIIRKFYNRQNKLSKEQKKTFKKYGIE